MRGPTKDCLWGGLGKEMRYGQPQPGMSGGHCGAAARMADDPQRAAHWGTQEYKADDFRVCIPVRPV